MKDIINIKFKNNHLVITLYFLHLNKKIINVTFLAIFQLHMKEEFGRSEYIFQSIIHLNHQVLDL